MRKSCFAIALAVLVAIASSAFAQDERAEAYMVLEGQIDASTVIGLVPEGIRINSELSGEFTEGLFAGATAEWASYLHIRHDGVRVIDNQGYAEHQDGTRVAWTMKGYFAEPGPPPLEMRIEAMRDPDFEFPDVDFALHGAAWFQTMAPEFAFVNHTVFRFNGTLNPNQGTVRLTFRSLAE